MIEANKEHKQRKKLEDESQLQDCLSKQSSLGKKVITRASETGAWLSATPNTLAGTELGKDEWRDSACCRYNMRPESIPKYCDGCGKEASIDHILNCRVGGLIICRHNELKDELIDIGIKAFGLNSIRDEPLTNPNSDGNNQEAQTNNHNNNNRADIMMRGLWERGTDGLIDVQIVNTDSTAHRNRTSEAVKTAERSKKKKHLAHCQQQRRYFTPSVVSTDGLLGDEANAMVKRLATVLSQQWEKAYSRICGQFRSRIGIAIVRATQRCLRGSRIPRESMSTPHKHLTWDDAPSLHLSKW